MQHLERAESIEVQHGLIVERASKVFSFSHLTFQEYLAARWLSKKTNWEGIASNITQQRWQEVLSMAFMLPNADRFAQTMKAEIDRLVETDMEIQRFLTWLKNKSQLELEKTPYKLNAIRSFYFSLIVLDIIPDHERYSLARILDLSFDPDDNYTSKQAPYISIDRKLVCVKNFAYTIIRKLDSALESGVNIPITGYLSDALKLVSCVKDNDLQIELQKLKFQLPDTAIKNFENTKKWWSTMGIVWIEQLRDIIITYRGFESDWLFSKNQKTLLQQYYEFNKLLVNCLKYSKVSLDIKQNIEDTLFLSIH